MEKRDFTDMNVWKLSFNLIKEIYSISKEFPSDEKFGLVSDMRRAVNSISNNIAEGYGRHGSKDKTRFYKISRGSCYELHNQLLICQELKYIANNVFIEEKIESIKQVIEELNKIIKTLESK